MKRWIKFLIVAVLSLSIPLQAMAAIAMPMCTMSGASMSGDAAMATVSADALSNSTCDNSGHDCCQAHGKSSKNATQNCFACYMSILQMPPTVVRVDTPQVMTIFASLVNTHYQTFPAGLYRPPKLLSN